jgi:uncharacterized membrane protein AbrB (regulator of aidB expression)
MAQGELVTISLMRRPSYQVFLQLIAGLLLALFAALLFEAWHSPLPWMLGPLFATATARLLNAPFDCPWQIRAAGQWAIGTVLGLYFTPSVIKTYLDYRYASSSEINHTSYVANHINFLR